MKQFTLSVAAMLLFAGSLFAQNEGTYLEEESVQDSTYMEDDIFMDEEVDTAQEAGSSSNTALYVGLGVVVVAGVAFAAKRKKTA